MLAASGIPVTEAVERLMALGRRLLHPGDPHEPLTLRSAAEWEALLEVARKHEAGPWLWAAAGRGGVQGVPVEDLDALRSRFAEQVRRNLLLTGELIRILQILRSQRVQALAMKGPVMAELAFGHLGLRRFVDLDILVRPEGRRQTVRAIEAEGYQGPDAPLQFVEWHRQVELYSSDRDVTIEVHWGVAPRFFLPRLDLDPWWDRAESVRVAGAELPTFGPEDQISLACVHGAKHCWRSLKWVADLAGLLIRGPAVSWDRLSGQFEICRAPRILTLGADLAHRVFGAPVPPAVLESARRDPAIDRLRAAVFAHWNSAEIMDPAALSGLAFESLLLPGVAQKAGLWWGAATAPTQADFEESPLPESLHGVYPIVRPLRLAIKAVRRLGSSTGGT